MNYNFKKVTPVPKTPKDFVDIILSRTQRKTPTVVHKDMTSLASENSTFGKLNLHSKQFMSVLQGY